MPVVLPTVDEPERVAMLHALRLLDDQAEPAFDGITRLAARLLDVPVALVTLIDSDRQWVKSGVGVAPTQIPREHAVCAHALHQQAPFVVPDALLDTRFAHNPLVTGGPHLRAYAGVALRSAAGHALGTLCVLDRRPREFTAAELEQLQELAALARSEILHREAAMQARHLAEQAAEREAQARLSLEARLKDATEHLQDLYDHAPCGYYSLDPQGLFVQVNRTALSWMGCEPEEVIGRLGSKDFITAEGRALFAQHFPKLKEGGSVGPLEMDLRSRDGSLRRVSVSASAVRDAQGRFMMTRTVMYDVSELVRVRRELQTRNREQHLMLDSDLIGIAKLRDHHAVWRNRALERMFGYEPGELDGQPSRVLYADDASYEAVGAAAYPELARGGTYRTQLRMVRKSGEPIWVDVSGVMLSEETSESMWLMLDITSMKQHQERVERMAFHDPLTGVPNRLLLMSRLREALQQQRGEDDLLAVCFIDLDGFKAVNDRLGHDCGDELLRILAQRLQDNVRSKDTVSRLGGDEFVLVLTHLSSREACQPILDRVLRVMREPVVLSGGQTAQVSASMGVAYSPGDGDEAQALLTLADQAMYRAKQAGGSRKR